MSSFARYGPCRVYCNRLCCADTPTDDDACQQQGAVNDEWVAALRSLSTKIKYTASHRLSGRLGAGAGAGAGASASATAAGASEDFGIDPANTSAGRDVIPQLERLRMKAVQRVREEATGVVYLLGC